MGMTWKEICADSMLASLPYRIESDQWGNIVMSPPAGMDHSRHQSSILRMLSRLMRHGEALAEFPLQTSKGVKGIDTVWISTKNLERQVGPNNVASIAPEICVEVISPSNRRGEIEEKMSLYFERGAVECWTCDKKGKMTFYNPAGVLARSELCPKFPADLKLSNSRSN